MAPGQVLGRMYREVCQVPMFHASTGNVQLSSQMKVDGYRDYMDEARQDCYDYIYDVCM